MPMKKVCVTPAGNAAHHCSQYESKRDRGPASDFSGVSSSMAVAQGGLTQGIKY